MINEIKLGLGDPPLPIYLYVNKLEIDGQTYCWYNYNAALDQKAPVAQRALTGYICEFRLTSRDFKGKDNLKLDIVVKADKIYVLRSGIETIFTKSILLAASVIEDFSRPITIVVTPGDENVVFGGLYDATTGSKIRRDWDVNADWATIIQSIQGKLGSNPKYEFEEDDDSAVVQPQQAPSQPPVAQVHSQDLRIKQIRTLLDYPVDLVREWLQFQGVKAPSQLDPSKVDQLVKTICLEWAAPKLDHPQSAAATYQQQVLGAIATGTDEVTAIRAWMNYVLGHRATVSSR